MRAGRSAVAEWAGRGRRELRHHACGRGRGPTQYGAVADELAHCLKTAGIRVVVTDAAHAALVSKLGADPVQVETTEPADLARCDFPAVPAEGWGRIGFTSGTTGTPKGIVHSQLGRWTANVLLRASLPVAPGAGDNVLLVTPFSHGAALLTYAFLDGGAAVTLLPGLDAGKAASLSPSKMMGRGRC